MFLVSSRSCLRSIHWSQVLSWEWRCSWSSADRRCSNYIWVINNFIVYKGATYIRGFTVCLLGLLHRSDDTHTIALLPTSFNQYRGRFQNAYELLNLRALKISMLYKSHIFQCMGKIFCVEFQRVPLKFHTKYHTQTLEDVDIIHRWKFKSS